jgi:hypothetical protein
MNSISILVQVERTEQEGRVCAHTDSRVRAPPVTRARSRVCRGAPRCVRVQSRSRAAAAAGWAARKGWAPGLATARARCHGRRLPTSDAPCCSSSRCCCWQVSRRNALQSPACSAPVCDAWLRPCLLRSLTVRKEQGCWARTRT